MSLWKVKDLINELEKYPKWKEIEVSSFEGSAPIEKITENNNTVIIEPYM